jgi:cyclopropane fatty-acyl-phospholipid synthase-like methyltransferase
MLVSLQNRIDAAVECNVAPDEYFSVWDELADWQLNALKTVGLLPNHKLLDFGCGALRFGLLGIDYLDDGNYYGIDAFEPYINIGHKLIKFAEINKSYKIIVSKNFKFQQLNDAFDFGIAQSVFTHMSGQECDLCMTELKKVMSKEGIFLFTFLVGEPLTRGMLYLGAQPMMRFAMKDPAFFENLASKHGISFYSVDIPHVTNQQVAIFKF